MTRHERDQRPYTALFCEENVWQLAREMVSSGKDMCRSEVLFFVNAADSVVMLNQRAADPGMAIGWDYHVVLRVRDPHDLVFDADTRLPYPCATREYLLHSFPRQSALLEHLQAWVRRVPVATFLSRFDSDRSHMRGRVPAAAFPPWPTIRATDTQHAISLRHYCDVTARLDDGSRVLPLDEFLQLTG